MKALKTELFCGIHNENCAVEYMQFIKKNSFIEIISVVYTKHGHILLTYK